jgi:methionyl-tRNA formyltransferase
MPDGSSIVFMGTPEFAVESLKAIVEAGIRVKGVVTSPDKPAGRGLQMHASPVKEFALKYGLPVLQPLKLKDPDFLDSLRNWQADLQVIVAFRMLPEEVWAMPPKGTFNLHASLLPQYRGAAPINWAVINGETRTGVTTFFLNHEIDKGSVIYTAETGIGPRETAGDVHDRLMKIGAQLVVKTIRGIDDGVGAREQQWQPEDGQLHAAPKIFRDDCRIKWDQDTTSLYNFIRGLSPYPAAWAKLETPDGRLLQVKIFFADPLFEMSTEKPGTIRTDGKTFLHVVTGNGLLSLMKLQIEGKKPLGVAEFLRGFPGICLFR